jgi:asparagine synthase (glutamine-hydrolysing)
MSGIAGVVRLDGGPVDRADVAALATGVAHLGPDRLGRWDGEGVGMVHALLAATPEAVGERQPAIDGTSGVAVVLDGRLDNRAELLEALSRLDGRRRPAPVTDAAILARAYEGWALGCVPRLLGDFAFALWDGRRRRLLLGRDPLGVRPLLYRVVGRRLAWASVMKPLANLPGAPTRPNPGMVAESLANSLTSRHETVYAGVYRLPPAHTLVAEGGTVRWARYWDVDPAREVRHASHQEYADHLRDVLTAAVRARLRTVGPVVAELSGGLDSSTVVGIAQREARRTPGGREGGVKTVSLVYPGEAADESCWIDSVNERWGIEPNKLLPRTSGTYDFLEESRRTGEVPDFPVRPHGALLYGRARDLGARSVLNGIGGDEWLAGSAWAAADLLRAGRVGDALARARVAARHQEVSTPAATWRFGVRPVLADLLPPAVPSQFRARRIVRRAPWIPPAFARSVALEERLQVPTRTGVRSLAQALICFSLDSANLTAECEAQAAITGAHGTESRMPFLDVRVIALALAVPEAERCGTDRPKRLLRTAARGLVPDGVLDRSDDPGPSHLMVQEVLAPAVARHLGFVRAEAEGWVDGARLRAMHAEVAAARRSGTQLPEGHLWPLWRAMAIEMWLDAAFTS